MPDLVLVLAVVAAPLLFFLVCGMVADGFVDVVGYKNWRGLGFVLGGVLGFALVGVALPYWFSRVVPIGWLVVEGIAYTLAGLLGVLLGKDGPYQRSQMWPNNRRSTQESPATGEQTREGPSRAYTPVWWEPPAEDRETEKMAAGSDSYEGSDSDEASSELWANRAQGGSGSYED